jgi:hypothetical protein
MNSSPDPLKGNSGLPGDPPNLFNVSDNPADLPPNPTQAKPLLQKIFLACLAIGLVLGLAIAIVVVNLLDRWGLTDVPAPKDVPAQTR